MKSFEQLRQTIIEHQAERTIFKDELPEQTIKKLIEEVLELQEAIQEAQIGGSITNVANELGDVFIVLLTLADKLGIDILDAGLMKQMRNEFKGTKTILNNGYEQPYAVNSEVYEVMGGDRAFYYAYLMFLAEDD